MKYRKKPVVIEAFQYKGDFIETQGSYSVPDWAITAFETDEIYFIGRGDLFIHTLEGEMFVNVGDYIIKGVKGELYPCKPDIFEATYDIVLS